MDVANLFLPVLALGGNAEAPRLAPNVAPAAATESAQACPAAQGSPGVEIPGPRGGAQIGAPAPALQVDQWVGGPEFWGFELGRVYAVAFFSPWSEGCSPTLPDLAHFQTECGPAGLDVLGISGSDSIGTRPDALQRCTQKFGELVNFRVGFDAAERTRTAWVGEGHHELLPRVVLIGQRGTVAFIGEPRWLAMPLARVLRGDFKVEAGNAEVERAKSSFELLGATARRDPLGALAGLDAFEAEFPEYAYGCVALRFAAMLDAASATGGSLERAYEFGAVHVKQATGRSDHLTLDRLALAIIDPARGLEGLDLELAKRAADQAERITGGQNAAVLDTLSRVHLAGGNLEMAISVVRRACDVAPESLREQLHERLAAYRKLLEDSEQEVVPERKPGQP